MSGSASLVVSVEKHSERVLVLKMVLGDCLLNVFTVYAPHSGKPDEEKESFWDDVFHLVSCIPENKMVVFAGDMNGHIGSSNVGYDGTHGGFGYGSRNTDGSRILEFADRLNLVICNTLFTKQEAKLVTYVAGPVKSTVDCRLDVSQGGRTLCTNWLHTGADLILYYGRGYQIILWFGRRTKPGFVTSR